MAESSSAGFDIDPEFMRENATNLVKPRKKFAPYTKAERLSRRKEVYRLHFELGLPAVGIADAMNVDKNTINNDIQLLYRELRNDTKISYEDYYAKQTTRLEIQRSRLVSYLEKADDLDVRLRIERQITDIDFRLMAADQKVVFNDMRVWDQVVNAFNEEAEKSRLNYRLTGLYDLYRVSPKGRQLIDILKKEKVAGRKPASD